MGCVESVEEGRNGVKKEKINLAPKKKMNLTPQKRRI